MCNNVVMGVMSFSAERDVSRVQRKCQAFQPFSEMLVFPDQDTLDRVSLAPFGMVEAERSGSKHPPCCQAS
jgi:hypothetical protein